MTTGMGWVDAICFLIIAVLYICGINYLFGEKKK